jgi:hypothetical protein
MEVEAHAFTDIGTSSAEDIQGYSDQMNHDEDADDSDSLWIHLTEDNIFSALSYILPHTSCGRRSTSPKE